MRTSCPAVVLRRQVRSCGVSFGFWAWAIGASARAASKALSTLATRIAVGNRAVRIAVSQPSTTGLVCQISCAYCAIVRSDENAPMPATFRIAIRVHASESRYNASTSACLAT